MLRKVTLVEMAFNGHGHKKMAYGAGVQMLALPCFIVPRPASSRHVRPNF